MRVGLTISAVGHAALLLWSVVSFAARSDFVPPTESLPIDIISASEFSQMTAGSKDAPKKEPAKPKVEKIGDKKLVDNPATKIVDNKPEIVRTTEDPKPPEPKPEPKVEPKPVAEVKPPPKETKPEPKKAEPDPPIDPIAEQLTKSDAKKPDPVKPDPPKQVAKKPDPPKKPPPKYDPSKMAALLNKLEPRRQAAAGDTISSTQALGTATGTAALLAQNIEDALGAQIHNCWKVPSNFDEAKGIIVYVHMAFRQDGYLAGDPVVTNHDSSPLFPVVAETALRAIRQCQPYRLPIAKYEEVWKEVDLGFDPAAFR
jgi:outer membrane biosynthesis protein TonB